jgi:hypothetical protein
MQTLTDRNVVFTAYHDSTGLVIFNVLSNLMNHLLRIANKILAVCDVVKPGILLCLFHRLLCTHTQNFPNNLQPKATYCITTGMILRRLAQSNDTGIWTV